MSDDGHQSTGMVPGNRSRRLSIKDIRTFESFKVSAYRIYFGSMAGNWIGMSIQMMARTLLIYRLTDSTIVVGIMALARSIPSLLIAILGGAVADRIPKKYILVASRWLLSAIALGTAVLLATGFISPEHPGSWSILIVTATLEGLVSGFLQPANMSIIPEIVGEEHVMNAISLSSMGQNITRMASPIFAGWIIDSFGFADVYYIMAGVYAVAAVCTIFLPVTGTVSRGSGSTLRDMVEGLRYLKGEKLILVVVVFSLFHVISGQPFNQLLPVFTESVLQVSATKLGILTSVSSVGALTISLVMASIPNKKRGLLLLLSGVIMGTALVVFSFSAWWYLALMLMPFIGMGPTLHSTLTATIVQTYVEPNYRGRMQSFVTMSTGLASFGTFLAGVLSEAVGIQWAIGGMAVFLAVISLMIIVLYPPLRKMD